MMEHFHSTPRMALVCLAALIVWLSFQSDALAPLAFLALVPWFMALRGTQGWRGLTLGLTFGGLIWLLLTWWVKVGAQQWLLLADPGAWLVALLFSLYHALPYALFGLYQGLSRNRGRWTPLAHALALTALVYLFPNLFPGSLANALFTHPLLIQTADLGGVPLVFFLLVLVNALVEQAIYLHRAGRPILPETLALTALFAGILTYGWLRLEAFTPAATDGHGAPSLTLTAIQPNLPVTLDYLSPRGTEALTAAADLIRAAVARHPETELLVWPEVPPSLSCACEAGKGQGDFVRRLGKALLFACVEEGDAQNRHHNAALLIQGDGHCGPKYRKRKLLPFAEYLPLEERLPWLRDWFPGVQHYQPGDAGVVLTIGEGAKVIPSLCYEGLFPETVRQGLAQGGQLLVSMADDAWFGDPAAGRLHLALLLFRAVEYRIPLVRVTNTGSGAFIHPSGAISAGTLTPPGQAMITSATVGWRPGLSFYAVQGDVFLTLVGCGFLGLLAGQGIRALAGGRSPLDPGDA